MSNIVLYDLNGKMVDRLPVIPETGPALPDHLATSARAWGLFCKQLTVEQVPDVTSDRGHSRFEKKINLPRVPRAVWTTSDRSRGMRPRHDNDNKRHLTRPKTIANLKSREISFLCGQVMESSDGDGVMDDDKAISVKDDSVTKEQLPEVVRVQRNRGRRARRRLPNNSVLGNGQDADVPEVDLVSADERLGDAEMAPVADECDETSVLKMNKSDNFTDHGLLPVTVAVVVEERDLGDARFARELSDDAVTGPYHPEIDLHAGVLYAGGEVSTHPHHDQLQPTTVCDQDSHTLAIRGDNRPTSMPAIPGNGRLHTDSHTDSHSPQNTSELHQRRQPSISSEPGYDVIRAIRETVADAKLDNEDKFNDGLVRYFDFSSHSRSENQPKINISGARTKFSPIAAKLARLSKLLDFGPIVQTRRKIRLPVSCLLFIQYNTKQCIHILKAGTLQFD